LWQALISRRADTKVSPIPSSEITIKAHRGKVMEKMKAGYLADLVKMATKLHVSSPKS
jgi:FixJ family two-component response regulator